MEVFRGLKGVGEVGLTISTDLLTRNSKTTRALVKEGERLCFSLV